MLAFIFGAVDVYILHTEHIARIEVIYAPSGYLYGNAARSESRPLGPRKIIKTSSSETITHYLIVSVVYPLLGRLHSVLDSIMIFII